ncbi:SCO4402 family protein [Streptomyces sp. 1268]|uniref:SCO4402 family protein n=1 Tax=Streptomyces sp. 1268 TaxID=3231942 RepID=UPI0038D4BCF2
MPDAYVQYPEMRALILEYLTRLADPAWRASNLKSDSSVELDFDDLVNFIYDTSGLLNDPRGALGFTLGSLDEVEAVQRLRDAFEAAIEEGGLSGESPGTDPMWDLIGDEAATVVDVLSARGFGGGNPSPDECGSPS